LRAEIGEDVKAAQPALQILLADKPSMRTPACWRPNC